MTCFLYGTCSDQVNDPAGEHCSEHQYSEKEIKPVLDEAVNLLDSFMVSMSDMYERRVKKVINKRDEIFS
jgi:hypothetical protein